MKHVHRAPGGAANKESSAPVLGWGQHVVSRMEMNPRPFCGGHAIAASPVTSFSRFWRRCRGSPTRPPGIPFPNPPFLFRFKSVGSSSIKALFNRGQNKDARLRRPFEVGLQPTSLNGNMVDKITSTNILFTASVWL